MREWSFFLFSEFWNTICYTLYTHNGITFFLFWVYKGLTNRLTMNIRGGGWGSWSVSVLLHKVSAKRIISQYVHMPILSFIALFYSLIFHHWQGFTLLSSIPHNQPPILPSVRLKRKRQGKARRTEPKKASQNESAKGGKHRFIIAT